MFLIRSWGVCILDLLSVIFDSWHMIIEESWFTVTH